MQGTVVEVTGNGTGSGFIAVNNFVDNSDPTDNGELQVSATARGDVDLVGEGAIRRFSWEVDANANTMVDTYEYLQAKLASDLSSDTLDILSYVDITTQRSQEGPDSTAWVDVPGTSVNSLAEIDAAQFIAGHEYLIFANSRYHKTVSALTGLRLTYGGVAIDDSQIENAQPVDQRRDGYVYMSKITAVAGSDLRLQFRTDDPGFIRANANSIVAIDLTSSGLLETEYVFNENTSTTALTSTVSQHASITFTAPEAGDWLVMYTANIEKADSGASAQAETQLNRDSGTEIDLFLRPDAALWPSINHRQTVFACKVYASLGAGSHTFDVELREVGASMEHTHSAIFALRLSKLDVTNFSYAAGPKTDFATNNVYEEVAAADVTPNVAGDYIVMASMGYGSSSSTQSGYGRPQVDGSTIGIFTETQSVSGQGASTDVAQWGVLTVENFAASLRDVDLDAKVSQVITEQVHDISLVVLSAEKSATDRLTWLEVLESRVFLLERVGDNFSTSAATHIDNGSQGVFVYDRGVGTVTELTPDSGSVFVPEATVTLTVNVKDAAGDAIRLAQVAIFQDSDSSELLNTNTLASGTASGTFTYTSDVPVTIRIRKNSAEHPTRYSTFRTAGTITSSGLTVDATLIEDTIVPESVASILGELGFTSYWGLGESSGDALDTIGVADGTVTLGSGVRNETALNVSPSDGSTEFDSANTKITAAAASAIDNIWDGGGSLFFMFDANSDGELSIGYVAVKNNGWNIRLQDEGSSLVRIRFEAEWDGSAGWWVTAVDIPINTMIAGVLTYDADADTNNPTLYLWDGSAFTTRTVGSGLTETAPPTGTRISDTGDDLIIGSNVAQSRTFDGHIDEIGFHNGREITQAEATRVIEKAIGKSV